MSFIHGGDTAGAFTESVAQTLIIDGGRHIRHVIGFQSSPRIAAARCMVVAEFLKLRDADWLWFLDADMAWKPEMAQLLFDTADRKNVPVLGGLCFAGGRSYGESGKPNMWPTIYRLIDADGSGTPGVEPVDDFPRNELVKVGATGAACLLIHRDVLTKMGKQYARTPDGLENPYPWFSETVMKGRQYGEDVTFCLRAQACGFPVHVHTGVDIKHRKAMYLDTAMWDEQHKPKPKLVLPGLKAS